MTTKGKIDGSHDGYPYQEFSQILTVRLSFSISKVSHGFFSS